MTAAPTLPQLVRGANAAARTVLGAEGYEVAPVTTDPNDGVLIRVREWSEEKSVEVFDRIYERLTALFPNLDVFGFFSVVFMARVRATPEYGVVSLHASAQEYWSYECFIPASVVVQTDPYVLSHPGGWDPGIDVIAKWPERWSGLSEPAVSEFVGLLSPARTVVSSNWRMHFGRGSTFATFAMGTAAPLGARQRGVDFFGRNYSVNLEQGASFMPSTWYAATPVDVAATTALGLIGAHLQADSNYSLAG